MSDTETGFVAGRGREMALTLLSLAEELGHNPEVVRKTRNGYIVPADVVEAYEERDGRSSTPDADDISGIEDTSDTEREKAATDDAKVNAQVTKSETGAEAKADAAVTEKHDAPATVDEAKEQLDAEDKAAEASVEKKTSGRKPAAKPAE